MPHDTAASNDWSANGHRRASARTAGVAGRFARNRFSIRIELSTPTTRDPAFTADPDRLRRFEQEARAAGVLNHPNILAIYDIGTTAAGAPYLVSELLA